MDWIGSNDSNLLKLKGHAIIESCFCGSKILCICKYVMCEMDRSDWWLTLLAGGLNPGILAGLMTLSALGEELITPSRED